MGHGKSETALYNWERLAPHSIEPYDLLKDSRRRWVEVSVSSGENTRASEWTQSIAVGSKDFVESTKLRLGIHAQGRKNHRGRVLIY